jgi:hypothetical protein
MTGNGIRHVEHLVGDGESDEFALPHDFGTTEVIVSMSDVASGREVWMPFGVSATTVFLQPLLVLPPESVRVRIMGLSENGPEHGLGAVHSPESEASTESDAP